MKNFVTKASSDRTSKVVTKGLSFSMMVFGLIVLSGCAETQVFAPHSQPGNGNALVYFIRDSYPPHKREAQLYVNQHQVATMADDDAVAINVPVGDNAILVTINGDNPLSFDLPIKREEVIYIALTGNVRWTGGQLYANKMRIELTRNIQATRLTRSEAMSLPDSINRKLK